MDEPVIHPKTDSLLVQEGSSKLTTIDYLFCNFLRQYFSDPNHLFFETVKDKIWNEDVQQTKIRIEPIYYWNLALVDTTPAILVRRGELKQMSHGMYGGVVTLTQGQTEEVYKTWQGMHEFLCLSKEPAEADEIALEVAKCLSDYKRQIINLLRLAFYDVIAISPINVVNNTAVPVYACGVQVGYMFSDFTKIIF